MKKESSFELFQMQRECLKKLQKEQPDLFIPRHKFDEEKILPEIGITFLSVDRLKGFLRLYPQDFIVEEIHPDGSLSLVEPTNKSLGEPDIKKFTLYADLVKVGISSLEAISRLAEKLEINANKIGFAGIKDAQALTSQRIALPGIKYGKIKDIKFDSFFLTNFFYGRGTVERGYLAGNKFTIFIRTEKPVNINWLKEKLLNLKEKGFLNYYHTQRFGGERLLSYILGKLILQGKYEEAIKEFLTKVGKYDIRLIEALRIKAERCYGDWRKMKKVFSLLPYTFQNEIKATDYLSKDHDNFIGALIKIQDQTTLWVYAYASFLFNKYLSQSITNPGRLPKQLPLLLSDDLSDRKIYQKWLVEDNIVNIDKTLKPFKFIRIKKRFVTTKIFPKDIMGATNPDGVALGFSLSKGAYATTFLMNLFTQQGLPLPQWVKTTEHDVKKILKTGTIASTKEILKDYIFSVLDLQENSKETE